MGKVKESLIKAIDEYALLHPDCTYEEAMKQVLRNLIDLARIEENEKGDDI